MRRSSRGSDDGSVAVEAFVLGVLLLVQHVLLGHIVCVSEATRTVPAMTKFTINEETNNEYTVEASSYGIEDGFVTFYGPRTSGAVAASKGPRVFSIAAGHVVTVRRDGSGES